MVTAANEKSGNSDDMQATVVKYNNPKSITESDNVLSISGGVGEENDGAWRYWPNHIQCITYASIAMIFCVLFVPIFNCLNNRLSVFDYILLGLALIGALTMFFCYWGRSFNFNVKNSWNFLPKDDEK